ncbi:MAG: InlB B-repeat-containing protein [Kiritimatiellae bacterium]|nr:InlB B-repeat-containing protein [Kiritimatiellia bacterium]
MSGGIPPYTFALAQGSSMPDGLSFDNGAISGAPTVAGSHSFTVSVTDSASLAQVANFTYTLYVKDIYSITYYDGASTLSLSPSTYTEGVGAATLPRPTKNGWAFVNWYDDPGLDASGNVVTAIPSSSTGAVSLYAKWEEDLSGTVPMAYVDASGTLQSPVNCTVIDSTTTTLNGGWYVVANNVTFNDTTLTVSGDVKIILRDDKTMTVKGDWAKAGINVALGNSLTIYCQTAGTGALVVTGGGAGGAAIGGNQDGDCGTVTINGGVVTATGYSDGAAIGGGRNGAGGTVIVNGGTVTATGATACAGIGGGKNSSNHGTLTIGEYLFVASGYSPSRMTTMTPGANGSITLDGERYYTIASVRPVPISYRDTDGTDKTTNCVKLVSGLLTLSDGWYAVDKDFAPNAGFLVSGDVKLVLCDGATLVANGNGNLTPGISVASGNSLTIYGQAAGSGRLEATGYDDKSGIGGGRYGSGGTQSAGCGTVTVNGGTVIATGGNNAAGIGGGYDGDGGTVTVNGGAVTATGGNNATGIGGGFSCDGHGTLTLAANMVAYAGASENPETTLPRDPSTGAVASGSGRYYVISCASAVSEFSITYMSLGEPLEIQPGSYVYGTGVATLPTPAEAPVGCAFAGWYEAAEFSGLPVASIAADATGNKTFYAKWNEIPVQENVAYVDGTGEAQNALCTKLTAITERLTNGWYVVADSLTLGTLTVSGTDVHLVIKDGKTLTVTGAGNSAGLMVTNGNAIAIYAQSGGTGALVATGGTGAAGIGGNQYRDGGAVTINGGTVTATGGTDGPGIGAGQHYAREAGSLTVAPWLVVKAGDSANPSDILAKDANGAVTLNRKRYFTVSQGDSHAITYMDGETELHGLMPTNYVEGMVTMLATTATKEGFAFVGWYTNSTFAGSVIEKITADETGDKTFYAKWYASETVPYVDANGDAQTTNGVPLTADMTNLVSGCYVAKGTLDFGTGGIVIAGDVMLVLADDASMSVTGGQNRAGITVSPERSLTIYGQTAGTGALVVIGGSLSAGIGGDFQMTCGAVTVNGGNVTANGQGGAGVGGGFSGSGGTVTVNGGTVTAGTTTSAARGIGGGMNAAGHGTLVVGPGMVAKGGDESSNLTLLPSAESTGLVIVSENMRYYRIEKAEEEILPLTLVTGTFYGTNGVNATWSLADTVCYGTKPYSFALKAGSALPDGFTLENGVITGTPEASGTYRFTVVVTDATSPEQQTLEVEYAINVSTNPNMLTQVVFELPRALSGFNYSYSLPQTIEGGKKPYTFVQKEAMGCYPPSGIKVDGTTRLSGIPTGPGSISTMTLVVTDANGVSTEASYRLNVEAEYVYTFDANDLTWKFIWSENTSLHETRIVLYNDGYQDGRDSVIDDATEGAIVIPARNGRTSVTCIGDMAFYDCTNITSVTIPNSITAIGDLAFCGCTNLTSMRIPSSVVQMGDYAFLESALETVYVDPGTIASVSNLLVATDEDFDASALEFIEVCDVTLVDGIGGATTNMMRYGQAIGTLPVLAREHYTFDGWFTAAEGGVQIDASTLVEQDVTYYAHWTIDTFTVTFAKNDGTDTVVESRRIAYGERVGTVPEPTRDGYTFYYWWTDPRNNMGTTVTAYTPVTEDITCYAHWTPASCRVRFLKNDGTDTVVRNLTTSYGATLGTLPTPTRDGYTLNGWFTAAEGGTQVDSSTLVEGNVDYYAQWTLSLVDWPANTSTVAGKTAGEAFEITGDLANVNAKTLADWAKGAGGVNFADRGDIISTAFLLNCANTAAPVTAATPVAEEAIKITAITIVDGVPQLTYPATYGNGEVVIQGSATIGSTASWHDGKQTTDRFFKTVLRLKQP